MVWKANSDSAERTASFTFQLPDFKTGLLAATNGSLESRKSKWPLILQDFKMEVRLFMGKGHGDVDE